MYFSRTENMIKKGNVIIGLCKLRRQYITDKSVKNERCKDRAIFSG